jgi:twitching motility protein PilT
MIEINQLLKAMVDKDASDLHLRAGGPPIFRLNGSLFRAQTEALMPPDMARFCEELMNERQREIFAESNELDFAVGVRGIGRFRVNAFRQRGTPALAIRATKAVIPAFNEINVPEVCLDLAMRKRGLILVTGTTGSGKSTLLASLIDHINNSNSVNVVTIEDPIEFLFRDKKSTIAQREVGTDTSSFKDALRSCFREDPDVILIGEIRDKITMETALSAADTGHMVMSTLHTMNCVETISRIISFFPPYQHDQVRLVLSGVLVAIISLRLLPRKDGAGRIPATEILINNATIAEYLMHAEKSSLIMGAVRDGFSQYGSRSFDQSLLQLYRDDIITLAVAKQNANNPDDFELKVGGVEGTSERGWTT